MSVPTNKKITTDIDPHISSTLRDLHLGKNISVVFVGSHSKMYCSELALSLLYIPE